MGGQTTEEGLPISPGQLWLPSPTHNLFYSPFLCSSLVPLFLHVLYMGFAPSFFERFRAFNLLSSFSITSLYRM